MNSCKKCIIVVPVYKVVPDELEQLSLKQLDNIINNTIKISLIAPSTINEDEYLKLFVKSEVDIINFDNSYFTSLESYSRLCLEYKFYKTFDEYEYMLMYQPDCWIFRNEILEWCDKGYDYVGAPIYSAGSNWPSLLRSNHPMVGNGGLSLRKMSKMLFITNPDEYVHKKYNDIWSTITYEDMFICDMVAHDIYINIPDYRIAEKFSIDFLPNDPARLNPMGAHRVFVCYKFWKNRLDFLNDPHIQELCVVEIKKTFGHYNHNDSADQK